ncbi:MAG: beta-propeller domain-containing protein [Oscillospiraceae bacterium]|jgi:uncharacterized secreted protein with C-terminal beta-propeller domain|nr:beta-propeller domain-containing protein [Oscillospiraceae bacterium]
MTRQENEIIHALRVSFDDALENTTIPATLAPDEILANVQWEQAARPQRRRLNRNRQFILAAAAVLALCVSMATYLSTNGSLWQSNTMESPPPLLDEVHGVPHWDGAATNHRTPVTQAPPLPAAQNDAILQPGSATALSALFQWFRDGGESQTWGDLRKAYGGIFNAAEPEKAYYNKVIAYSMRPSGDVVYEAASPEGWVAGNVSPAPPAGETQVANAPTMPAAMDSAPQEEATVANDADSNSADVGNTNVQVDGVDEQDILKNSGKTLFIAQGNVFARPSADGSRDTDDIITGKVRRVQLLPEGKMKELSPVVLFTARYGKENTKVESVQGMFLHNGLLVVISQTDDSYISNYAYENWRAVSGKCETIVRVYGDADGQTPKLLYTTRQDGAHLSSRLYNGQLTVATTHSVDVWAEDFDAKKDSAPQVGGKAVAAAQLYCAVNKPEPTWLVVTGTDLNAAAPSTRSCAVLGAGENLYSSGDTLYIARTVWNNETNQSQSEIYKFSLAGAPKFVASGKVPGSLLNQFSMDEYQSNLRVATQSDGVGTTSSAVYVLDKNLKTVGKVRNIAPGERIQSVRFVGDTGYVVTFLQTDPLFVLDLSNAKKPKVVGELKIPGFSSYLHPVGEGYLLGIGVPGNDLGTVDGVKLSLFDVRNPKNPKEVDNVKFLSVRDRSGSFREAYSTEWSDAKSFLTYPSKDLYGLPIFVRHDKSNGAYIDTVSFYYTFTVNNGKIVPAKEYVADAQKDGESSGEAYWAGGAVTPPRATYVNEVLYTRIAGSVYSYDMASGQRLAKLVLG